MLTRKITDIRLGITRKLKVVVIVTDVFGETSGYLARLKLRGMMADVEELIVFSKNFRVCFHGLTLLLVNSCRSISIQMYFSEARFMAFNLFIFQQM